MRSSQPPAILIGAGMGTAMSVARSLGRRGVEVHLLGDPKAPERYSRYVTYISIPRSKDAGRAWAEFLLGPRSNELRGAVLLACSDIGIELIMEQREELARKYLLDISNRRSQALFLNKLATYRLAEEAGIPTPRFWVAENLEQVQAGRDEYVYPLLIKPIYSHRFTEVFGKKFLVADDFEHLLSLYARVDGSDVDVLLLEKIPGPDDRLCSYFSYLDEAGKPQFHYTKRVIRRYPENHGLACYHITDWIPEVRDVGLRLLTYAEHAGLGNVEFKLDERDGRLKVIECNARFTAANALLAASGYDLATFVYDRVVGRPGPSLQGKPYKQGLRMWYPGRDTMAFFELRRTRGLTLGSWSRSLMHRQVFPYFRWYDPLPTLGSFVGIPRRLADFLERRAPTRAAHSRPQPPGGATPHGKAGKA